MHNKTWNLDVVKKRNKSLVLNKIINEKVISRADIAKKSGLNKGTVSTLVNELLAEDLIYESGPGESSGGRRPVMLLFNNIAGYSIGIDLGVNYLFGVLTNLSGNIFEEKLIRFNDIPYKEIEQKLFTVIEHLISSAPECKYGIVGIGIGVPGTVNNKDVILLAPNLNWKNIQLKEIIEEKYNIPVIIENEANAGAYGEKKFGVGQDFNNIIYISAGIGIGVGLILNGELYRGNNGFSGELGHMTIEVNGAACSCGNEGCWELYASERALIKNAQKLGITIPSNGDSALTNLLKLAQNNDPQAISLFEEIGDYLGVGINNIINTFNPQQVVIGNQIAASKELILGPIEKRVARQGLWFQQLDLQIDFSKNYTLSTPLGVAAFSIERFLQESIHQK